MPNKGKFVDNLSKKKKKKITRTKTKNYTKYITLAKNPENLYANT